MDELFQVIVNGKEYFTGDHDSCEYERNLLLTWREEQNVAMDDYFESSIIPYEG
jgi:hypothetical protein